MTNRLYLIGIFLGIVIVGLIIYSSQKTSSLKNTTFPASTQTNSNIPTVISTNPPNLTGETIIGPSQAISITFNLPIKNPEQFKSRMDPATDYIVTLSPDRKTATITPKKPYGFNHGFTLFIDTQTQFDGGVFLGKSLSFSFHTISYSGV